MDQCSDHCSEPDGSEATVSRSDGSEAMASGAPVIAYGKGGILDTVNCINEKNTEKVKNGLLFKNQTAQDIFDTISWFEDKKLWRKFKPEILNEYSQNFSIEKFITKIDFSINKAWEIFNKKNLI